MVPRVMDYNSSRILIVDSSSLALESLEVRSRETVLLVGWMTNSLYQVLELELHTQRD
jgi:hypothetical protein